MRNPYLTLNWAIHAPGLIKRKKVMYHFISQFGSQPWLLVFYVSGFSVKSSQVIPCFEPLTCKKKMNIGLTFYMIANLLQHNTNSGILS